MGGFEILENETGFQYYAPMFLGVLLPKNAADGVSFRMQSDLFTNAIKKVQCLALSDAAQLTLEEVGVLRLFLRSRAQMPELSEVEQANCAMVRAALDQWARTPAERPEDGQETPHSRRSQHILRNAVQKLCQREYAALSGGEILFLRSTQEALEAKLTPDVGAVRLRDLLERELAAYEAFVACLPPSEVPFTPGAQAPDSTMATENILEPETAAALLSAESSATKPPETVPEELALSGGTEYDNSAPVCELDAQLVFDEHPQKKSAVVDDAEASPTARVYEMQGNTRLKGDVPEGALLLVHNGSLIVDGMVEGNIAAAGDVTINGTVAGGCVISNAGNILARVILARSRVIAKRGNIKAERAEDPACLFSLGSLHIRGDAVGGKYLGGSIRVDGTATSAEMHSVGRIQARAFRVAPNTQSVICLRKTLSSEDYGTPPPAQERKLYRSLGKFTHDGNVLAQFIHFAERDVADAQRALLFYLLGGEGNPHDVRSVRGLQCQAGAFAEYVLIADRLVTLFRDAAAAGTRITGPDVRSLSDQCIEELNHLGTEIGGQAGALDLTHKNDLYRAGRLLSAVTLKLVREQIEKNDYAETAQELARQCERWNALGMRLLQEARAKLRSWGLDQVAIEYLERAPEEVAMKLESVFVQARRDSLSMAGQRASSSVARLLLASIDRNQKNIRSWRGLMKTARDEFSMIRKTLFGSGAYLFANEETGGAHVIAEAFDMGVVIAANPAVGGDPVTTAQHVLMVNALLSETTVYRLRGNSIGRDTSA